MLSGICRRTVCFPKSNLLPSPFYAFIRSKHTFDGKAVLLSQRSVISVKGREATAFLQGLISNDISYFRSEHEKQQSSLYAVMLNNQGRLLYDVLLYNMGATMKDTGNEEEVFLECDSSVSSGIVKLLNVFKLKRAVSVSALPFIRIYAVGFKSNGEISTPLTALPFNDKMPFFHSSDPRISCLGYRVLLNENERQSLNGILPSASIVPERDYHATRYELGIPEGVNDLPPGKCFPLESNIDYLNGISFHKGCYVGQELTARTHHTGVVRKRLMPLTLLGESQAAEQTFTADNKVVGTDGASVGKVRGGVGKHGLALLRVEEALKNTELFVQTKDGKVKCETKKPFWWSSLDVRGFQPPEE